MITLMQIQKGLSSVTAGLKLPHTWTHAPEAARNDGTRRAAVVPGRRSPGSQRGGTETPPFLGSEGGSGGLLCQHSVYLAQTHACFCVHNIFPMFFSKSGLTLTVEITNTVPGVCSAGN